MFERAPGAFTLILEQQHVLQAAVVLQVIHAVAEGKQHLLDGALGELRHAERVFGGFDDHFVRADALHPVEEAFALTIQIALDSQHGELVGHHAEAPARLIGRGTVAEGEHLRWCFAFVAGAERAEAAGGRGRNRLPDKISGPPGTIGGDNHPTVGNGIFTQFRHSVNSPL